MFRDSYAAYAGNDTLDDVVFYGGIPYIQPPVGDLRFGPPQQLDESTKWLSNSDVVDARNWGPICIQQPAVVGIGSEGTQSKRRVKSLFFAHGTQIVSRSMFGRLPARTPKANYQSMST